MKEKIQNYFFASKDEGDIQESLDQCSSDVSEKGILCTEGSIGKNQGNQSPQLLTECFSNTFDTNNILSSTTKREIKPNPCHVCFVSFLTFTESYNHRKIHTEKLFLCEFCLNLSGNIVG